MPVFKIDGNACLSVEETNNVKLWYGDKYLTASVKRYAKSGAILTWDDTMSEDVEVDQDEFLEILKGGR